MTTPSPRELVLELAAALRDEVLPELGNHAGRAHSGAGEGGDVTFAIDERAEAFMEEFLAERAPEVAFYSEDRGMVEPPAGEPGSWSSTRSTARARRWRGSRPPASRSPRRAWTPSRRMGDVVRGCVVEIKSGRAFVAERGEGLDPAPPLSANRDLSRMFWAYGLRGRPGAGDRRGARGADRRLLGRRRRPSTSARPPTT